MPEDLTTLGNERLIHRTDEPAVVAELKSRGWDDNDILAEEENLIRRAQATAEVARVLQ